MTENREYLLRVREEIEMYYNGFEEDEEEKSLYDYLMDTLDYELSIDSAMNYISCKVWITLGGPNVWIDTRERAIKLAWANERDEIYLNSEICDEIDVFYEEVYNSCR